MTGSGVSPGERPHQNGSLRPVEQHAHAGHQSIVTTQRFEPDSGAAGIEIVALTGSLVTGEAGTRRNGGYFEPQFLTAQRRNGACETGAFRQSGEAVFTHPQRNIGVGRIDDTEDWHGRADDFTGCGQTLRDLA